MTTAQRPRRLPRRAPPKPTGPLSAMTRFTPPEWPEAARWAAKWLTRAPCPPGLFLEDDSAPVIDRLLRKAARTPKGEDLQIRVNREEIVALREQLLFWECCQDEFPLTIRQDMPSPQAFASLANEAELTILELGMRPDGTTRW